MQLNVRAPTLEEEKRRVDGLVARVSWYQEHGYDVYLPTGRVDEVYRVEDYQPGIDEIEKQRDVILRAMIRLKNFAKAWSIDQLRDITVVMTKYGVGGSYDVDSCRVVVFVKPDGTLTKPAAHLVVHEILHIATDRSLVEPFNLSHNQKERFVDLLCRDVFGDLLVDYRMQPMGDVSIDEYFTDLQILDLPSALRKWTLKKS